MQSAGCNRGSGASHDDGLAAEKRGQQMKQKERKKGGIRNQAWSTLFRMRSVAALGKRRGKEKQREEGCDKGKEERESSKCTHQNAGRRKKERRGTGGGGGEKQGALTDAICNSIRKDRRKEKKREEGVEGIMQSCHRRVHLLQK